MSDSWDNYASDWDQNADARFFADQVFQSLIEHVDVRRPAWRRRRILDFGCGTGLLTEKLAPLAREVIAIDTSPAMIDVLQQKDIGNVSPICADINDPAVHSSAPWFGEFDLIVASSVCGFLPNYESTIGILSRALTTTGCFAQWDWLATGEDGLGLTLGAVAKAFTEADLVGVHIGEAFTTTSGNGGKSVLVGVARPTAHASQQTFINRLG